MKIVRTILFLSLFIPFFFSCKKKEEKKEVKNAIPVIQGTEVLSLRPEKPVVLPGELHSWNKVSIYSKVKGFVKEVKADRGTEVRKGQVLAILDAPEVLSQLDKARNELHASESSLQESKARWLASRITYERLLNASKTPGAVAPNELDQAKARMLEDSSNAVTAEGNLKASRSHYRSQSEIANYLTITAPFNGTIIERNISPGTLIGAGEANGKPMFVLEDNSTLRLTIAIPEHHSNALSTTKEVSFTVNASPDQDFNAKFGRSAESILEKNRVMMTEFDVDNSKGKLKSGMYAEVKLPLKRSSATLFVPSTAVVSSSEQIFVIKSIHNKAQYVPVKKGISVDTLIEIFGELRPGDIIVQNASEEIREGQPLQIKNQKLVIYKPNN